MPIKIAVGCRELVFQMLVKTSGCGDVRVGVEEDSDVSTVPESDSKCSVDSARESIEAALRERASARGPLMHFNA